MPQRHSLSSIVPLALALAGAGAIAASSRGAAVPASIGLPGEWMAALAFSVLFLRRFMDSRDLRGLVGAPERQRVVSLSWQLFIDGRRN